MFGENIFPVFRPRDYKTITDFGLDKSGMQKSNNMDHFNASVDNKPPFFVCHIFKLFF